MNKKMLVVSKGLYRGEEDKTSPVSINEYVFIRDNGKKYLLLRFTNKSDLHITSMTFWLTQKNSDGRVIDEKKVVFDNIRCVAWEVFSPDKGILVDDKCADVDIKITSVISGNYEYRSKNGESFVRYLFKQNKRRRMDMLPFCTQHSKTDGKVKFSGAILILALVLIFVATFLPIFTDIVIPWIIEGIKAVFSAIGEALASIGNEKA